MSIYELKRSFDVIFSWSRLLGIAPISWAPQRRHVSLVMVIYGAIIFCLLCTVYMIDIVLLFSTWSEKRGKQSTENSLNADYILNRAGEILLYGFGTLWGSKRMIVILRIMDQIEMKKNQMDNGFKQIQIFFNLILVMIILTFGLKFLEIYLGFTYVEERIVNYKDFIVVSTMKGASFLLLLQFVVVGLVIHSLLLQVNNDLERHLYVKVSTSMLTNSLKNQLTDTVQDVDPAIGSYGFVTNYTFNSSWKLDTKVNRNCRKLREISHTYISFCMLVRDWNDSESGALIIQLLKVALNIVGNVLKLINILGLYNNAVLVIWGLSCTHAILNVVLSVIMLLLIVEPLHRAQSELKRTRLLASKALNQALDRYIVDELNELRLLFKQLHLNRPIYTAFGMCTLGRPLVTTVLSAITTFLIMKYQ